MTNLEWATALPALDQLDADISSNIARLRTTISASADKATDSGQHDQLSNKDQAIDDLRISLIDRIDELRELLLTPRELLLQSASFSGFVALHAMHRFEIAKHIPLNGTRSHKDLASVCGLSEKNCRRFVRQACLTGLLRETKTNEVGHTKASELLAENKNVDAYIGAIFEEGWPAAIKTTEAVAKWPTSTNSEHSGYVIANGMPLYKLLAQDKRRSDQYVNSLEAFAGDRMVAFDNVVNDFDWSALGQATIVDVGGSLGSVSKVLARAFPKLNLVVEDLPGVITKAKQQPIPEDIKDRIRFLSHDMFQTQPIKDADVYYFRSVMFDWPDDKVIEILSALKPALKPSATVLIQDNFVPEPGIVPRFIERRLRSTDLLGLAIENHSVRDLHEWRALFDKAGPGFEFVSADFLKESGKAMIQARWAPRGNS